ncbi:MAG: Pycsar system effector family protein [Flavobacteriales bacterium]
MEEPTKQTEEETTPLVDPQLPPARYEDVDPYTADHRDYLLNQSRVNLMAISQMSDLKANLMLTLSAVLLQFALSKVSDHTLDGPKAHYWVMVVGALVTILLCAYATLPKGKLLRNTIKENGPLPKGFNLLFFTSYIQLSLPDYKARMNQVLSSPPRSHDAILEELHTHGRFIAQQKYVPLRLAYFTFLLTWLVGAVLYAMA